MSDRAKSINVINSFSFADRGLRVGKTLVVPGAIVGLGGADLGMSHIFPKAYTDGFSHLSVDTVGAIFGAGLGLLIPYYIGFRREKAILLSDIRRKTRGL